MAVQATIFVSEVTTLDNTPFRQVHRGTEDLSKVKFTSSNFLF